MPAPPELGDAARDVWLVEVLAQPEAEHAGQADRHVRVGAEVDVDLEGEEQHAPPGVRPAEQRRVGGEAHVGAGGQRVGQDGLLDHAEHEAAEPFGQVPAPAATVGEQLRLQLVVLDDRPGQQLGKQEHVEQVGGQARRGAGAAACDVDQVGDLLEHDEGDADRQRHLAEVPWLPARRHQQAVQVVHREPGVLVVCQQAQVDHHACRQRSPPSAAAARHQPGERVVGDAGRQHDGDEGRLAPQIEEQAGRQQQGGARRGLAPDQEEAGEHDGEEQEEEERLVEQHQLMPGCQPCAGRRFAGCR